MIARKEKQFLVFDVNGKIAKYDLSTGKTYGFSGREVKNIDLWLELYRFMTSTKMEIQAVKVKGHSGDKYNELVDKAAKEAIRNLNANSAK